MNVCSHDACLRTANGTQPGSDGLERCTHETQPSPHYFQDDAYELNADALQLLHNDEPLFRDRRDVGFLTW